MISRREFVKGSLATAALGSLSGLSGLAASGAAAKDLADPTKSLLEKSDYVYVSPLGPDGAESTCHGEVWFSWIDGAVVLVTSKDAWKARSLAKGRDGARIWVGNHGRWKGTLGARNEEFRKAPKFDARVTRSNDEALLEKLMASYQKKYPAEIGKWEPRFRDGFATGERLLLRYVPV
jgi:hypothetical protein